MISGWRTHEHACITCRVLSWSGNPEPDCYTCNGTGIDTRRTGEPVCPYCGAEQYLEYGIEHKTELWCDNCDREFDVYANWEVTYSSYKREE